MKKLRKAMNLRALVSKMTSTTTRRSRKRMKNHNMRKTLEMKRREEETSTKGEVKRGAMNRAAIKIRAVAVMRARNYCPLEILATFKRYLITFL